jgi:intein-encoded DNA endonuclease-like protein
MNPSQTPEIKAKISESLKKRWANSPYRIREGRLFAKEELEKLYLVGRKSMKEIAKEKECSIGGVDYLMRKYGIKKRNRSEVSFLLYQDENERDKIMKVEVNLQPSKDLAYILGVLVGDGWVGYRYSIGLGSTSKEFAESFANALKNIGLHPNIYLEPKEHFQKRSPNANDLWRVIAYSRQFYKWYKDLNLEKIKEVINGYEVDFVRGFYESEGSCRFRGNSPEVGIHNTNRDLIIFVSGLLTGMGFNLSLNVQRYSRLKPNRKDCFSLHVLGKREEKLKFLETINPIIKGGN